MGEGEEDKRGGEGASLFGGDRLFLVVERKRSGADVECHRFPRHQREKE